MEKVNSIFKRFCRVFRFSLAFLAGVLAFSMGHCLLGGDRGDSGFGLPLVESAWGLSPSDMPQWAHEKSRLKPDPGTVWGKLPNGFRYVLLRNSEPRNRV